MSRRAAMPPHAVALLVVALAAVVRLPALSPHLDDLDSWRQTDTATIARNFLDEPNLFYPRIDWGAPGPGYVESELQLYPFAVHLLYRLAGERPIYGRWLSIALFAAASLIFYRLVCRHWGERQAGVAVALFAATPMTLRYGRAFMPEMAVLLCYLLALERFLAGRREHPGSAPVAAAGWLAAALLIKPTSLHLGLVLALLVAIEDGPRRLLAPRWWRFAAVALLPAAAWYLHAASLHLRYGNTFGVISGGDVKWGSPAWWLEPRFYLELARIEARWMLGWAGLAAAAGALGALALRHRGGPAFRLLGAWALSLGLYLLIVARYSGHEGRGTHYHLFAAPFLALGVSFALSLLWRRGTPGRALAAALVLAMAAQLAGTWHHVLTYRDPPLWRQAGASLAELSRPGELVVVLSDSPALEHGVENNFEQPHIFFHARRRGRSLAHDRQHRQGLQAALSSGARWLVNLPALNDRAEPSYHRLLEQRLVLRHDGGDFEIFEVRR